LELIWNVERFIFPVADDSRANCCQIRGVETHCSVKTSLTTQNVPDTSSNPWRPARALCYCRSVITVG